MPRFNERAMMPAEGVQLRIVMVQDQSKLGEKLSGLAGLDQRSREIFRQLVDTYIETGMPVGSRTLSRDPLINLSPASVRNIMADLEEFGLLAAPHTSAGRMPTELGLRFFVDAIMEQGTLSGDQRRSIDRELSGHDSGKRVEDVLTDATNLLSGLSQCAGVVVAPKLAMRLRHIEFVKLSSDRALVVLVGDDGTVENRAIGIPPGLPASTLTRVSNFLSSRLQGKTLAEAQGYIAGQVQVLESELDQLSAKIIEDGFAVWSGDGGDRRLIVRGQSNLIDDLTAMEDLERVRSLFDELEQKRDLLRLLDLTDEGEGVRIYIGSESDLFSLSGSSLIVAPYHDKEQNVVGVLGVIGPTRINYARIVPMVNYTARLVGRLLS